MTGPRTDVRRRRGISYSAIMLVVVVLLIAVGAVIFLEQNKTTTTTMPDVVGQQLTAATRTLKSQKINVGLVRSNQSKEAAGTILRTIPKAGAKVTKGDSVEIIVSKGITTTPETVPSVVDSNVTNAISDLHAKKLLYKIVQTTTAPPGVSATPNTVLSQSPTAGATVQSGTTVILTVLASSAKYDLDSLSGETSVAAGAALATQGLTAGPVTRVCSDTIRQGLVVATNPAAGSLVSQGQAITLELSSGPCTVFMPNVLNDTESVADQLLESQGLTPSYSPDPVAVCEAGATPTVASQANASGTPVKYGSTVDLTICQTPADTTTTAPTTTTTS